MPRSWIPWLTIKEHNQLDRFVRVPSDLRRYLEYNAQLKKKHGSVMDFVVKERLRWTDLESKDIAPFNDPATGDIKILYNDWPYGIDERIIHLVVWTKFDLPDDPNTKELTTEMRREIDEYVNKKFGHSVPKKNVSRLEDKDDVNEVSDAAKGDLVQELEVIEVDTLNGKSGYLLGALALKRTASTAPDNLKYN
ncbi:MAG: hypothetical protein Q9171_005721 [Xanthocarpia ochracea]